MEKLKKGDKVEIIANNRGGFPVGTKGTIALDEGCIGIRYKVVNSVNDFHWYSAEELKLCVPNKQRIKTLEEKVESQGQAISELKIIVEQLRKPSATVSTALDEVAETVEFNGANYRKVSRKVKHGDLIMFPKVHESWAAITPNKLYPVIDRAGAAGFLDDTNCPINVYGIYKGYDDVASVVVYERSVAEQTQFYPVPPAPQKPDANVLRAEAIEKAKKLVKRFEKSLIHFVITDRKVIAIEQYKDGSIKGFAHAKCHPDNVFNLDLGKAIAVGRLKKLDVTEFENAIQPDGWVVGQIVTVEKDRAEHREFIYRVDSVTEQSSNLTMLFYPGGKASADLTGNDIASLPIIDDTNAQYAINK
ncbi:hypothetical protein P9B03_04055 [Metasolibacillus meyeri]|uniref:Uncharacterized protein n=1 Tax=Metasolibacillus meyeri TaxID=1071052 RepID=A0AAW9NRZ1_9BACL|nr:hypothetical protein [Metasolibacillus meyeri]MEC1177648.1 hypothetical protein [Metasolibacillus meyeri]